MSETIEEQGFTVSITVEQKPEGVYFVARCKYAEGEPECIVSSRRKVDAVAMCLAEVGRRMEYLPDV